MFQPILQLFTIHYSLLTIHLKRKHCLRKPGSVLACHLSSPRVTPWLKRSTLHRKSGGQPSDDGIRELAAPSRHSPTITRRLVVSYTTFSPLLFAERLFSSAGTCCHQQLPLSEVGCPMLPGLSSCVILAPATSRGSVFEGKSTK